MRLAKLAFFVTTLVFTTLFPFRSNALVDHWFWISWDTNCATPFHHTDNGTGVGWCCCGSASPTLWDPHQPGFGYVHGQTEDNQTGVKFKWDTCQYCEATNCVNVITSETNALGSSDYTSPRPEIVWYFDCENFFTNKPPSDDKDGSRGPIGLSGGGGPPPPPPPGGPPDGCPTCDNGCDDGSRGSRYVRVERLGGIYI